MPAQIHVVGPLLPTAPSDFTPPTWWDELIGQRPVVHVTHGTVAADARALVLPALHAVANAGGLVVATPPDPAALGALPANTRVEIFSASSDEGAIYEVRWYPIAGVSLR